jgi:hypothetical protein
VYGRDVAEDIVLDMFIDDGVLGRGHRINLWGEAYAVTASVQCDHAGYDHMAVIGYAGRFDLN